LARQIDSTTRDALVARIRFYRDLGMTEFYRRPVSEELLAQLAVEPEAPAPAIQQNMGASGLVSETRETTPSLPLVSAERMESHETQPPSDYQPDYSQEDHAIPPRKPIQAAPQIGVEVPAAQRAAALELIREEIGDCTRCALHTGRHKIVFGDGDAAARLLFVGEGPGADEDAQGIPFVGKAGQLLNNMINAMGLKREQVYIANVVKCRPPANRTPEPAEGNTCSQFLFRQIDVVRPEVIVALGATAATYLLGVRQPLAGLRGRVHAFRGSKLIITYHPAYLLRDPRQKKEAWADLQIAMRELGLKPPKKG
jgi:uracil-DNA glycosylase family 4